MAFALFMAVLALFVFMAFRLRMLTLDGAFSSWGLGVVITAAFGYRGLGLLLLFFISSSLLSKWGKEKKKKLRTLSVESTGRNAGQVFANGGAAFIAGGGYLLFPHPFWLALFIGSLAEASADTWASEIGVLSKGEPYHLLRRTRVERGISGAVSPLGLAAAALGSLLISATGALMFFDGKWIFPVLLFIFLAGFLGNVLDTIIGGTVQLGFRCRICGAEVEEHTHCGVLTEKIKGWSSVNNNTVNFISSTLAGLAAGVVILWIL
ncbi:DUF92 domain-containing protein [Fictibacillus fluitans]|uniref:DUF92 domain-containing protein n=1 Tax=Fictibacillus fluitans TaxID=3058422 RepID=A0ABT8HX71_9BACL|nr:DUF92 domain-containing protein [Fictibacillus sp. NE201]MDN4525382.1 DUF92 domain-containing protein [Fictibacillus sp. NE201]